MHITWRDEHCVPEKAQGRSPSSVVAKRRLSRSPDGEDSTVVTAAPRWSRRAATLAVLTTLPSGIWRRSMALGLPVGVDETYRRENYGFPGWGTAYAFGLTLLLFGLAFLTLGLAHRCGEVTLRWMPFIETSFPRRLAPLR